MRVKVAGAGISGCAGLGAGAIWWRWWYNKGLPPPPPQWVPQKCDTPAIVPAYRLPIIGAGLWSHSVQRHLAAAVLT